MYIQIQQTSTRPVYQQIVDQIKRDIALGRTVQGDRLPTVRQLASSLTINPNTIAKAYRQLEQEGVIATKAGAGAFVACSDPGLTKSVKRRRVCAELERAAVEAYHLHVDRNTLCQWFEQVLTQFQWSKTEGNSHD